MSWILKKTDRFAIQKEDTYDSFKERYRKTKKYFIF